MIALVAMGLSLNAQTGIHQGMIRAQSTLGLGLGTSTGEMRYYVYSELEGMVSDKVGMNGCTWFQVGASQPFLGPEFVSSDEKLFTHNLFAGPNYHFLQDVPLDFYIGVQPGLAYASIPYSGTDQSAPSGRDRALAPAASLNTGLAYYGSFFHLFVQARGVYARHLTSRYDVNLSDIRLSFGLGFNIN